LDLLCHGDPSLASWKRWQTVSSKNLLQKLAFAGVVFGEAGRPFIVLVDQ